MRFRVSLLAAACAVFARAVGAQELEPRSYSPSLVGLNSAAVAYGYSTSGVVFDPSLPVTDITALISRGASVRVGTNFTQIGAAWQAHWF